MTLKYRSMDKYLQNNFENVELQKYLLSASEDNNPEKFWLGRISNLYYLFKLKQFAIIEISSMDKYL